MYISVIKPKITSKPCNITTKAGLPVTLTCYVEGDPNHYWVGWMSRHSVIQEGEEHSISTSLNSRSPNSTTYSYYLTAHSVKKSNEYECIVYTMEGVIQDRVTHHVLITEGWYKSSTLFY